MGLNKSSIIMFSLMSISLGCIKEAEANEQNDNNNYIENEVKVINSTQELEESSVENSDNNQNELKNLDKENGSDTAIIFGSSKIENLALKLREELKQWKELKELKEWQDEEFGPYVEDDEVHEQQSGAVIYENSEPNITNEPMDTEELKKDIKKEVKVINSTQELEESSVENSDNNQNELKNLDKENESDTAIIFGSSKIENLALKLREELKQWEELKELKELKECQDEEFGPYVEDDEVQDQQSGAVIYENSELNISNEPMDTEELKKDIKLEKNNQEELLKKILELLNHKYVSENKEPNKETKVSENSDLSELMNMLNQEQDGLEAVINKLDLIEKNIENKLKISNTNSSKEQVQELLEKITEVINKRINSNYFAEDENNETLIHQEFKNDRELNKVENDIPTEIFDNHINKNTSFKVLEELKDTDKLKKNINLTEIDKEKRQKRDHLQIENYVSNRNLSKDISIDNESKSKFEAIKNGEKQAQTVNEMQSENKIVNQNLNENKEEEKLLETVLELVKHNYFLEDKKINRETKVPGHIDLSKLVNMLNKKQDGVNSVIDKLDLIEKNSKNNLKTSKSENKNSVYPDNLSIKDEQFSEAGQEVVFLKNQLSSVIEESKSNLNKLNDLFCIIENIDKVNISKSALEYKKNQKNEVIDKTQKQSFFIEPMELLLSMWSLIYIYKIKKGV